jgi:hypothetical protein
LTFHGGAFWAARGRPTAGRDGIDLRFDAANDPANGMFNGTNFPGPWRAID